MRKLNWQEYSLRILKKCAGIFATHIKKEVRALKKVYYYSLRDRPPDVMLGGAYIIINIMHNSTCTYYLY